MGSWNWFVNVCWDCQKSSQRTTDNRHIVQASRPHWRSTTDLYFWPYVGLRSTSLEILKSDQLLCDALWWIDENHSGSATSARALRARRRASEAADPWRSGHAVSRLAATSGLHRGRGDQGTAYLNGDSHAAVVIGFVDRHIARYLCDGVLMCCGVADSKWNLIIGLNYVEAVRTSACFRWERVSTLHPSTRERDKLSLSVEYDEKETKNQFNYRFCARRFIRTGSTNIHRHSWQVICGNLSHEPNSEYLFIVNITLR